MDAKLKHLELIQGVVNRLAAASFRIKGWAVVLVGALLVLVVREDRAALAAIGFIPVALFWGLDAYFLWQERLFRALYDHVRLLPPDEIDFSMDVSRVADGWTRTWQGALLSRTLLLFYVALAAAVAAAVAAV